MLLLGDFNFRLTDLSRPEALALIDEGNRKALLNRDSLTLARFGFKKQKQVSEHELRHHRGKIQTRRAISTNVSDHLEFFFTEFYEGKINFWPTYKFDVRQGN